MIGIRPTEPATLADVNAMRATLDMRRSSHVRIAAILGALSHGLRRGEVCGLHVEDFREHNGKPCLRVRTLKRRKEVMRFVPLGPIAAAAIGKYVSQEHGATPDPTAPLFRTAGTRYPLGKRPITWKGIECAINAALRETGIERRITAHSFRHGFATGLLQGGADLRTVQEILGHASVQSTGRYLHTTQARMAEAVEGYGG